MSAHPTPPPVGPVFGGVVSFGEIRQLTMNQPPAAPGPAGGTPAAQGAGRTAPNDPGPVRFLIATSASIVRDRDGADVWRDPAWELRAVRDRLRHCEWAIVDEAPAVSAGQLQAALNRRPHVLHIAAAGTALGPLLQADDGTGTTAVLTWDRLAEYLRGTDDPPRVVVLSGCWNRTATGPLLVEVPVVVGVAPGHPLPCYPKFADAFYDAIAHAQPLGPALAQARTALRDFGARPESAGRAEVHLATTYLS